MTSHEAPQPAEGGFSVAIYYQCPGNVEDPRVHSIRKVVAVGGSRPLPPEEITCRQHQVKARFSEMSRSEVRGIDN